MATLLSNWRWTSVGWSIIKPLDLPTSSPCVNKCYEREYILSQRAQVWPKLERFSQNPRIWKQRCCRLPHASNSITLSIAGAHFTKIKTLISILAVISDIPLKSEHIQSYMQIWTASAEIAYAFHAKCPALKTSNFVVTWKARMMRVVTR